MPSKNSKKRVLYLVYGNKKDLERRQPYKVDEQSEFEFLFTNQGLDHKNLSDIVHNTSANLIVLIKAGFFVRKCTRKFLSESAIHESFYWGFFSPNVNLIRDFNMKELRKYFSKNIFFTKELFFAVGGFCENKNFNVGELIKRFSLQNDPQDSLDGLIFLDRA